MEIRPPRNSFGGTLNDLTAFCNKQREPKVMEPVNRLLFRKTFAIMLRMAIILILFPR